MRRIYERGRARLRALLAWGTWAAGRPVRDANGAVVVGEDGGGAVRGIVPE